MAETPPNITYLPIVILPHRPWERGPPARPRRCVTPPIGSHHAHTAPGSAGRRPTPAGVSLPPLVPITPAPPLGARASGLHPPVCHSPHWFPSRPRRPWERGPPAHTRRCVTPPQMNVVHALTTTPDPRSRSVRNYPLFSLLSICVRPCTHPQAGGTEGITACSVHRSNPPQAGELGGKQDCGAHDAHRRTGAGAGPPGSMPARGHSHQRRCRSGASTRRPQPVSGTSACLA